MRRQAEAKARRDAKKKYSSEELKLIYKHNWLRFGASRIIGCAQKVIDSKTASDQAKVYAVEIENLAELMKRALKERKNV